MTLLIACLSAICVTVIWYTSEKARAYEIGTLCYLYWGATIMWFVDAIYEYLELRAEYFAPAIEDMVNDAFLGVSVVAFGLVIWLIILLVKDPSGVVRSRIASR